LCADDSAATSVKVGYRQANYSAEPAQLSLGGLFAFGRPTAIVNTGSPGNSVAASHPHLFSRRHMEIRHGESDRHVHGRQAEANSCRSLLGKIDKF
ncbi:hypothetical protein ACI48D_25850, partial [Massilia sp. LXY-6]|uniref:hypothetical protein n=1 Tax=Massilia sp. LXY-6 TaxID=3379823 RepID=UPI003EDEC01A